MKKNPQQRGFVIGSFVSCQTHGKEILARMKPQAVNCELDFPKWKRDPREIPLEIILPERLARERRLLEKAGYHTLGDAAEVSWQKLKNVKRVGTQTRHIIKCALRFYNLDQQVLQFE